MNNLFDRSDVSKILSRIEALSPSTENIWGKMNVAQMLAHCNISLETAMGLHKIKGPVIGRIIGTLMRPNALGPKPFGRNSPTDKSYVFPTNLSFDAQKEKLVGSIQRFNAGGPSVCTDYPHPFFGRFSPDQWAVFQWKHLDHHLRQFGV